MENIEVGDKITFKAACRWGCKKVTRIVKAIDSYGRPQVGYGGYSHFIVKLDEISEVVKGE